MWASEEKEDQDMTNVNDVPLVYIAGPMTGHTYYNYAAFYEAYDQLQEVGYRVSSPAHDASGKRLNPPVPGYEDDYRVYLADGIRKLLDCDLIFLLPGWRISRGAQLEKQIADAMGIREVTIE